MKASIQKAIRRLRSRKRFSVKILRMPYVLDENLKFEMLAVFRDVMRDLSFTADESFLEKLYQTDVLILIRHIDGQLAGFANIVNRTVDGRAVNHILAMYIAHAYRKRGLMQAAIERWLSGEMLKKIWTSTPIILTASAVNPQVVYPLAKHFEVWPDLIAAKDSPGWATELALQSSKLFYPIQTNRPFQVQIPPSVAHLQEGIQPESANKIFNLRFFEYANPKELKLLFFIAKITPLGLFNASLKILFKGNK